MSEKTVLRAEQVSRSFGGVAAVRDCSVDVPELSILGLVGPNGAGKSTLLRILAGEIRADSGKVIWGAEDITRWPPHRRGAAGLVKTFQMGGEVGRLTVLENLLLGVQDNPGERLGNALFRRRQWKYSERRSIERGMELLDLVGLVHHADDYASTLSGGERRLLELCRALMAHPKLLLLDEPMTGVSPVLRDRLIDLLLGIHQEGVTCVIVEHALDVVERLCAKVAVMAEGGVIALGSMDEIRANEAVINAYLS